MTIIKKEDAIMAEEIKKVNEEVKKQEEVPAEVVKEEVKADAPKEEAKVAPKKDKPKAETKKATGKKATAAKKENKQEKKQEEVKKELPPVEYKSLASSSKNTAIHSLMVQVKNGKLNLNHSVQRKAEQWKLDQKEKFLHSLIIGVISPEIVVAEMDGEKLFVVDGKQRLSCLDEYINKKDTKLTVFGRKFNELDDNTKDALTGSNINVVTYANVKDEDIFSLFERYNNGVSLSSSQKSRSYCSIALLDRIQSILNSVFIKEKCNITKGQSLKDEDTIVLVQACMIASGFIFKSFNGKEVDRYLQETETDAIMKTLDVIEEHIQILDGIVSDKEKNLKKIHLPMILACANDTEAFKNKLLNFLNDYENQTEYRQYCQGSTSQKENVLGRLNYWKP